MDDITKPRTTATATATATTTTARDQSTWLQSKHHNPKSKPHRKSKKSPKKTKKAQKAQQKTIHRFSGSRSYLVLCGGADDVLLLELSEPPLLASCNGQRPPRLRHREYVHHHAKVFPAVRFYLNIIANLQRQRTKRPSNQLGTPFRT